MQFGTVDVIAEIMLKEAQIFCGKSETIIHVVVWQKNISKK